ncbi:unnamed protein product [Nyctereutes procyonoides]|uniref:(raccoon dog) hypothetical protein n=1 Tax=Nyctereutes procyonoides TaxID=34880 RepID=A0A811ZR71_NYCPR|nr:unnamed protein product [Nyctereutes procyonoides]
MGIPGWRSGLAPAFGPGRDPGDPGSNPTSGSQCMEPASPSASQESVAQHYSSAPAARPQKSLGKACPETHERHLLPFRDWLVVTKGRFSRSCRFKQKLHLSALGVVSWDKEEEQDENKVGDLLISGRNALFFILASNPCIIEFPLLHLPLPSILTCALSWPPGVRDTNAGC